MSLTLERQKEFVVLGSWKWLNSRRKRLAEQKRDVHRAPPALRPIDAELLEDRVLFNAAPIDFEAMQVADASENTDAMLDAISAISAALNAQDSFANIPQSPDTVEVADLIDDGNVDSGDGESSGESFDGETGGISPELREIVFIDVSVDDYQTLVNDLQSGSSVDRFEIVFIDANEDGIAKVTSTLAQRGDYSAVHIVSHGNDRGIRIGDTWLSGSTLQHFQNDIAAWGESLTETGDLLFYGCDLAESSEGRALLASVSELTGADVAASDDATGQALLGGDWDLEFTVGAIETKVAFSQLAQSQFEGLLATVTVDTTADELDGDTSSIANLIITPGGTGISLREAILAANNTGGADNIHFNIGGGGTQTLTLGSALFGVTDQVIIDGTTQGGFSGTPIIEIDATGELSGLTLSGGADGSVVRGLVINRAASYGITINGGGNYTIAGNYIGTDVVGTSNLGNGFYGINMVTSTGSNTIGGTTAADRNVISGNGTDGIFIGSGSGNTIFGNYLGVGSDGTTAVGNGNGIRIATSNNTVGGSGLGEANLIAHNADDGVYIQSGTGNRISGNSIHSNSGLGIDLGSDGVTPNDAGDIDTGANNLQNFPLDLGAS
ncbi:MAG: DUF4347 domain-containing protein, partial [Planctomycetales bacterium]|nr:DUF4347 domain-containing protein [Planctomycetales bacterium]